jgi:transcriptional regulatory protein LEU3
MQSLQPAPIGWNGDAAWQYSQSIPSGPPPPTVGRTSQSPTILQAQASSVNAQEAAERSTAQKRRACNECRQQKLRCELANIDEPSATICSRCTKLGLECRIDETFKRTRKRKRSVDFEKEISTLKKQLSQYEKAPATYPAASPPQAYGNLPRSGSIFATTVPNGTSTESPEDSLPGTTTRPHDHEVQAQPEPMVSSTASSSRPRSLGNVEISVEEANELFSLFFANYHPFLPVLDPTRCSQAYYELSPLLFWCILAVAARRYQSNSTLLSRLAQTVPDLLWKTIRSVPHPLSLVQSLLLLCTWPFPTSSSATDPSYMLAGIAIHSSLQMGLHRPTHQQDFTKYRVRLSNQEVSSRISIWTACNIVAQCVSIGAGLQTPAHLHDWASIFGLSPKASLDVSDTLRQLLQIESFRNKVTQAFAMNSTDEVMTRPTHERLPMYKLFENDLAILEANLGILDGKTALNIPEAQKLMQCRHPPVSSPCGPITLSGIFPLR